MHVVSQKDENALPNDLWSDEKKDAKFSSKCVTPGAKIKGKENWKDRCYHFLIDIKLSNLKVRDKTE